MPIQTNGFFIIDFNGRIIAARSSTLNENTKNSRKNWGTWMCPWMALCSCHQYEPVICYTEKDEGIPYLSSPYSRVPWTYAVRLLNCSWGLTYLCSRHQDTWRAPRQTRFSPDFSVSQPRFHKPKVAYFPFHWKCWYLTRSDSSKERKSDFERVGIQFEMKEWASLLNNSLSSSMPSSLWTFYIAHMMIYDVDIIVKLSHYFFKGLKKRVFWLSSIR